MSLLDRRVSSGGPGTLWGEASPGHLACLQRCGRAPASLPSSCPGPQGTHSKASLRTGPAGMGRVLVAGPQSLSCLLLFLGEELESCLRWWALDGAEDCEVLCSFSLFFSFLCFFFFFFSFLLFL